MYIPLRENIEAFCKVMDSCIASSKSAHEQWKDKVSELEYWSLGRMEAFEFVLECLQKYLKQDEGRGIK